MEQTGYEGGAYVKNRNDFFLAYDPRKLRVIIS